MENMPSKNENPGSVESSRQFSGVIKILIGIIVVLVLGILVLVISNYKSIFGIYPEGQHPSEIEKRRVENAISQIERKITLQDYNDVLMSLDEIRWQYDVESNMENVLLYDKQREVIRQTLMELIKQQEITYNSPISADSLEIYKVLVSEKSEADSYLNLRSSLDSNYIVLDRMTRGTRVRVLEKGLGQTGNWFKVQSRESKKTGYANKKYLKQINPLENCLVNITWYYSLEDKNDAFFWFAEDGNFAFTSNISKFGKNVWRGKWEIDRYGEIILNIQRNKEGSLNQKLDLFLEGCSILKMGSNYFLKE